MTPFKTSAPFGFDSFGRLQSSDTGQRLDVEFIYDLSPDFFEQVVSGTGVISHQANTRDALVDGGGVGASDSASLKSYPVPYTPGNSQLINMTGVLNPDNLANATVELFIRSSTSGSASETKILQSSWAKLASGLDWTKSFIFTMSFQSLKVGTVKFFVSQDGKGVLVHTENNDFVRAGGYWQLANAPVSWNAYADGTEVFSEMMYGDDNNGIGIRLRAPKASGTSAVTAICATVKSEGGKDLINLPGLPRSVDMGVTTKTVGTTLIPLLSIRARDTFNSLPNLGLLIPESVYLKTDQSIKYAIVLEGNLTGDSWNDVDSDRSMVEFDIAATAISGGIVIDAEYIEASGNNRASNVRGLLGKAVLWAKAGSAVKHITLAAIRSGSSDADVLGGFHWEEIR